MTEYECALCALYFWKGERKGRSLSIEEESDGQWVVKLRYGDQENLLDHWGDPYFRNDARGMTKERVVIKVAKAFATNRRGHIKFASSRLHRKDHFGYSFLKPSWMKE